MPLIISEFSHVSDLGPVISPPIREQSVAVSGASTPSAPIGKDTRLLRLGATENCHVEIGDNPNATTGKFPIGAFMPEYVTVTEGQIVAVIAAA